MSRFAEDAAGLLETAEAAMRSGGAGTDTAILIGEEGGIRIVAADGWSLSALRAHHGARTAYRVTACDGAIRLEGQEPGRACSMESRSPARTARLLLSSSYVL